MKLILLNLFVLVAVGISVAGDIFAKTWALNKRLLFAIIALLLYTISSVLWLFWLEYVRLSIAVNWWIGFGIILTALAGIFYFHEKVTPVELIAMGLIIIGVLILNVQHA